MNTLCAANLAAIATRASVPAYDTAALTSGILHFGVGNFFRAHQARYLDALFEQGRDLDWGIVGAGVMDADERMRQALAAQDYLYTVVEQTATTSSARVVGCLTDYLPPNDAAATIARLADPAIRIVSMTITEGGYFIDPASGEFDPKHPAIVADAADPEHPRTVFGQIRAGLARRRAAGIAPFTVMSCDNVPHNGVVTRNALVGLARLSDAALADWIEREVAFPNGMVDRITPATGERERALLASRFEIEDASPVFCEDFTQWVLEDRFPAGRPALEAVGVQFVSDVTPFENMKIRILNGGHALIAYPAALLGVEFAHDAMAVPLIRRFLERVEREEILPIVPAVPDTRLDDYFALICRRFANPTIGDTTRRLCLDGSNRQPKFIIPSIRDRLGRQQGVDGLALASALWCRYCYGTLQDGTAIAPNDPAWERLNETARRAKDDPMAWLEMRDIYGAVAESPVFREAFAGALNALWADGVETVLQAYVAGGD